MNSLIIPGDSPSRILVVDDEEIVREIFYTGILRAGYECHTAPSGIAALEMLERTAYDVVITDIQMPGLSGIDLLQKIRERYDTDIMVMTGFFEDFDYVKIIELGAKDFIQKPVRVGELVVRLKRVLHERMILNQRNQAFQEVKQSYLDTLNRLALAAEYKDEDTGDHIMRIGSYCPLMGEKLGLPREEIEMIRHASPMHDVGKIGIPDKILLKPAKLTAEEFEKMKEHTVIGGRLLENSRSKILESARIIALTHHEKWDGSGYPNGLAGEYIPISGRIVALADTFDALTSRRPYKDPYPIEVALDIIRKERGRHFDPTLIDILLDCIDEFVGIKTTINQGEESGSADFAWSERDQDLIST